ncbi:MAG: DUF5309 family protein [Pyramidobacter sp.]|nr:DUF5309 family protein [Pyramidobacter sp.]
MAMTQYNNTGKDVDITDLITNISPTETPLMTLLGKADAAKGVIHSWEEDKLRDPAENAKVEGFDYSVDTKDEPRLLDNVCQIFAAGYGVTKTSQAVHRKNIKNKMAYNMRAAMKEIALDVEYALINNENKVTGNDDTARKMGGLPYFVKTNVMDNGGTARPLTWDLINSTIEAVKAAGGSPDHIVVSLRNKRVISSLLPINTTRNADIGNKKIGAVIDVFVSDFGVLNVLPDRWLGNADVYVLSSEYFGLSYLRPFKTEELPNTSDALKKEIVGELTLEARAEKASARITDLDGIVPTE